MSVPTRILIVDDEPLLVRLLRRVLESHGYEVFGAADGREALAELDRTQVDLVISDVRMPVMDGPAFLAELRRRAEPPPVVFLTGYGDYSDPELRAMGAEAVHGKPISAKELLAIVRTHTTGGE